VSHITYSKATETCHFKTQSDSYNVHNRLGDAILDLAAELIGLRYYATVLLYFPESNNLQKSSKQELSNELRQVYDSIEYIDVLLSFYEIIFEPTQVVRSVFNLLGKLSNGMELSGPAGNVDLRTIIDPENLKALKIIFEEEGEDFNIKILLAMVDEGNHELVRDVYNMNVELLNHL
jgi:hypothetical protein